MSTITPAMRKALKRAMAIAGGQSEMARRLTTLTTLTVSPQVVHGWIARGLPARWVIPVETVAEKLVSRHELRPDLYPPEEPKAPPSDATAVA